MSMPDTRTVTLACEWHGPMRHRDDGWPGDAGSGYWACGGWDGEGCSTAPYGVPDEAAARLARGETRWPGVTAT